MNTFKLLSDSREATIKLGMLLSKYLKQGDIVCLFGELGSGKTTLVKGIANGFGIPAKRVTSPTFVLMNIFEGKLPLYHFDFYRIENIGEIASIGCDEFLYGNGISVVEWADRFGNLMPQEYLGIKLTHKGTDKRGVKFLAKGKRYRGLIEKIKK